MPAIGDVLFRRGAVLALAAAFGCAVGCNSILGIGDVPVPFDASAGGGSDGGRAESTFDATAPDAGDAGSTTPVEAATSPDTGAAAADGAAPCSDTSGDPHNCGRCGHDCLGGMCGGAVCQPFALIALDAGVEPFGLAQDDTYLYWTDIQNDTVNRLAKDGDGGAVLTQNASRPRTVVVDVVALWFGDDNGIYRCAKTGCPAAPAVVAPSVTGDGIYDMAVDDDAGIYWTEESAQVFAAHKYGTDEPGSALWSGDAGTLSVATDDERVYFTTHDGVLRGVALDGGGAFAVGTPGPDFEGQGLALAAGSVYWTVAPNPSYSTGPGGFVYGVATAALGPGAAPGVTTLASQQYDPGALATDGTNLYWVALPLGQLVANGSILHCTIASCSPTTVGTGYSGPGAIVVDDTAVYWTNIDGATGNGSIWKLAK